jgi:hypothetical protein
MRRASMFLIFALVVAGWFFNDWKQLNNRSGDYLKELGLKLVGKVTNIDRPNNFNGFGIVRVAVIESNFSTYDPRKERDSYYCIVNNKEAEIYQLGVEECSIGDTIVVDTAEDSFTILKGERTIERGTVVYTNKRFYDYVRKYHQKF